MTDGTPPIRALVLAGGSSTRMHRDKALLEYQGRTQLDRAVELAARHAADVFVSVRASQTSEPARSHRPLIVDALPGEGPLVGIRSALAAQPGVAWLVIACDLPFLSDVALDQLLAERDPAVLATAFRSTHDGLPEPLCAVWEPAAAPALSAYAAAGGRCPRKFLLRHAVTLLEPRDRRALDNVNTPEEYADARSALAAPAAPVELTIQYFALLREQAGRSAETLATRAATPAELFAELKSRHGFSLDRDQLKVAVNGEFSDWSRRLAAGDAVVFIPPVAGG
jgi:molybdopterin-guanine dinucleotide biosynthesis protein A